MPFGGLIALAITCAAGYSAYRRLNVHGCRSIAVVFHLMIAVLVGEDGSLPVWSITFSVHRISRVSGTANL